MRAQHSKRRQGDILKDKHGHPAWHRITALFVGLVLVVAACGSDGGNAGGTDGDNSTTTTASGPQRDPVKGGSLIFGTESDVATLAPGEAAQPSDKLILRRRGKRRR